MNIYSKLITVKLIPRKGLFKIENPIVLWYIAIHTQDPIKDLACFN